MSAVTGHLRACHGESTSACPRPAQGPARPGLLINMGFLVHAESSGPERRPVSSGFRGNRLRMRSETALLRPSCC